jgi:hypothetical protein
MIKANIFKSKLALNNLLAKDILSELRITRQTYNQKLKGLQPFNNNEISKLKKLLNLSNDEVAEIFLD